MRRQIILLPCCTGQPRRGTLPHSRSTNGPTGQGQGVWDAGRLCWFQSARSTCVHGLVCAVKPVVTKQVSRVQVYVQSCVMPSESYPTLCLLVLVW